MKIAFASINGKYLDCHFGQCSSFSIFSFSANGYKWLESRSMPEYSEETHGHERIQSRVDAIRDCKLLFVSTIGNEAVQRLMNAGIMTIKVNAGTEIIAQLEKMRLMLMEHPPLWLLRAMLRSDDDEKGEEA
ncbi:NifB/NifX family molybdenum-iron cluster-binding protein [Gorillibacterium timonense]|uniref:NifB/NifX family molybdenum-iron cluster-binding protein n=1 Tax=Gorillibacterium timonense TaxID=1689269 RepID=UPI00071E2571|nr:NifB/NifX family molybdenum-iron cluster-binding protein [Gorillibacterium timonense]